MRSYFKNILAGVIVLSFAACKQTYDPYIETNNTKLLVVEGFINSGVGATVIHLSRSTDLNSPTLNDELNAQVRVEGENGSHFELLNNGSGEYSDPQLFLDNSVKYRLYIKTSDGKEYASDYSPVRYTPFIDSITWQRENGGLRLYVHAHDPQNAARYYQWKFEETWEFHAAYHTSLKYIRNSTTNAVTSLAFRMPDRSSDSTLYKCWNSGNSSSIILGSTEKLDSDVVYLPVQYIEPHSEKLSVLYSINLRQYALSHDNYLFLEKMKKNTEQLGTIFDPQPSEISGNIHCLTDPSITVIGHVEITEEQVKRIFIYNNQVPDWGYDPGCSQVILDNNLDSIDKYGRFLYPTMPESIDQFGGILKFYATGDEDCMNCTFRGTNTRPVFWP